MEDLVKTPAPFSLFPTMWLCHGAPPRYVAERRRHAGLGIASQSLGVCTQAGSCGQIITPVQALDHNQAIGMLPLASATSNTNVSRTQLAAPATPVFNLNRSLCPCLINLRLLSGSFCCRSTGCTDTSAYSSSYNLRLLAHAWPTIPSRAYCP